MEDPVIEVLRAMESGHIEAVDAIERAIEEITRINEETRKELGGTAK